ncbi:aldo/keto reductase [Stutzerimonas azotifigens]|uniref:Aldo/keto reductase n=1 Tax=Stutzerimonas azotifigens TaxID=291995 RepID=A0ABR5Z5F3_9GAMM|nr:aldo/keto reductase [Stutzerimonas azotifigens]MBA1275450.1 aldo/keto reductase [Stutzerimonas azotifigens]
MEQRVLGSSGLSVAPIVLGGNAFGWTLDEQASFAVLDAFVDHGFNAIDTADVYTYWAPGGQGGESETIIGRWLKARPGIRDKVVIFTKVGWDYGDPGRKGLSKRWIAEAAEASLSRLGVDAIDLYFSHQPDPDTPHEETLAEYEALIKAGKVKAIGASNFDAAQLRQALSVSEAKGLPSYQVLEPEYNLYDRASFDAALQDLCIERGLGVVTYFSLASGFLTGKYRSKADLGQSQRGGLVEKYFDARGLAILAALHEVASARKAEPAEVALAWLIAHRGVTAPIASATKAAHVESFSRAVKLRLSAEEIALLDKAGM